MNDGNDHPKPKFGGANDDDLSDDRRDRRRDGDSDSDTIEPSSKSIEPKNNKGKAPVKEAKTTKENGKGRAGKAAKGTKPSNGKAKGKGRKVSKVDTAKK